MPHDVAVFASIAATIVLSIAAVGLVGMRVHTYWRRAVRRAAAAGQPEQDRLARLEQAMDAFALDVERIAEGQRFLTRLEVERAADRETPALPGSPRADG